MVGFFEHQTHFRGDADAAPGTLNRPVFCGRRRDAADELGRDHS